MQSIRRSSHFASLSLVVFGPVLAFAQLRAGAGKVDITPPGSSLIEPYTSIHDHIYTRAILVEDGGKRALLMNVDVGNILSSFSEPVMDQISKKFDVPRENMIISAVHIHSSEPSVGGSAPGATGPTPNEKAFQDLLSKAMIDVVQRAKDALQPAEMGYGEGKLDLNVNRDAIDPKTRLWAQEPNTDGPSDKTFALVEFRKPDGGAPIAVYMNYAMHAVTMFLRGDLSADFPGVAADYIESVYDGKAVAVWTQAAEGDQNPLLMRPILAINEARIHNEMDPAKPNDPGEYNSSIMRLFLGGAKRPPLAVDAKLMDQSWKVVEAIGVISAESALRIMTGIEHFNHSVTIQGSSTVVTCPGRKRLDNAREGYPGSYTDGPAATVAVGALRLGDVALGHVNGEPYNKIGVDAKLGSPFKQTMIVVLATGGPSGGYMPSDDAAQHLTFQALGTKFKPGCAERGIANGIDGLLNRDLESNPGH